MFTIKTAIITGVNGQDGSYLSRLLLEKQYKVIGLIRNKNSDISNLEYLGIDKEIEFEVCDLSDYNQINKLISKYKPNEIYNLAAMSSVGKSFQFPSETLRFNIISVLNILESIRIVSPKTRFYQASSSEMFGKVSSLPITGDENYHPLSPYAVSKVSTHLMTKNYREAYGVYACTGILFNHESYLRAENFFIKKIIRESINISKNKQHYMIVGNVEIKRDFGFAEKYVEAMYLMMQKDKAGDYIVCSGKSVKLLDIIQYVFDKFNIPRDRLVIDENLYRPLEMEDIYGDKSKTEKELSWHYEMSFFEIIDIIIEEELKNYQIEN